MSNPKELDALIPGEAKRQREALRRKLSNGGPNMSQVGFPCDCLMCQPTYIIIITIMYIYIQIHILGFGYLYIYIYVHVQLRQKEDRQIDG